MRTQIAVLLTIVTILTVPAGAADQLNSYWVKENNKLLELIKAQKIDTALNNAQRLLSYLDKKELSQSQEAATTHNNIGMAYFSNEQFDKAQTHLFKALSIRQQIFGRQSPEVAIVWRNLAQTIQVQAQNGVNMLIKDGKLALVEQQLTADLQRLVDRHGSNSPEVAGTIIYNANLRATLAQNLLVNAIAKGEFERIRDNLLADKKAQAVKFGPNSLAAATSALALSQLYRIQAQYLLSQASTGVQP